MWSRRLVAALPPETIDAVIASLLRTGVTPADLTLLAPGTATLYRDVPRGLRVRSGRRVFARREATAIGVLAGALIGAVVVLTLGAVVAHLPGPVPVPVWLPPRELGGLLVSYVWIYGAVAGALLGAPLGAGRGMPATLARRSTARAAPAT